MQKGPGRKKNPSSTTAFLDRVWDDHFSLEGFDSLTETNIHKILADPRSHLSEEELRGLARMGMFFRWDKDELTFRSEPRGYGLFEDI